MVMGADGFPRMDGRVSDESSVFRSLYPAWYGARPRCQWRRQFRSQCFVTGLARALAAVPPATTVPVTVRCNGSGKGCGQGPTRDHSFGVWALATGLAKGHGATGNCSSGRSSLWRAWQGSGPRGHPRLQFRFQASMHVPAASQRRAPLSGEGHGATRDYSSGDSCL